VSWVRYYTAPWLKLISAANSFTVPCVTALMGHRTVSLTEHHPLCTLSVVLRTRANSVFFLGGGGEAANSFRKHRPYRHEYLKGALKWRNSLFGLVNIYNTATIVNLLPNFLHCPTSCFLFIISSVNCLPQISGYVVAPSLTLNLL